MCWPVDRPATHAAAGAAARGALIFCFGDCFTCSGATRRGLMRFLVLWGGAVVVCSEGGCGSMCWPVDRPATHAAAGAAARGALIFLFWGLFHTHGSGWHERVRGGGFNPLRGATTGVVMRRRATSGEMARGALIFCFGDSFTRPGVDGTPPCGGAGEEGWFLFFLWRLLRCRRGIFSHALGLGTRPFRRRRAGD